MTRWLLAGTVVLGCLATAVEATASTFQRIDLVTLVEHATTGVVQGRVISTSAAWDDAQSVIFTSAVFEVDRALAGPFQPGDWIVVREAGGEVDGYTVEALGFPRFEIGDELVLFLGPDWENGDHRIAGYGMGFYEVLRKNGNVVLVQGPLQDSVPVAAPILPGTPLASVVELIHSATR